MDKSRFLILLILIFLISSLLLLKKDQKQSFKSVIPLESDIESLLEGVQIKGVGKNNLKWELVSKKTITQKGLSQIDFLSPELQCSFEDNSSFYIKGTHGMYIAKEGLLQLEHDIWGHYQDINLYANMLQFFTKENVIKVFRDVEIKNNQIDVFANEGIIDLNKEVITLKKDVKVLIL